MRILLLIGWLMIPVVFAAWHYGPGQEQVTLDDVAQVLAEADGLAANKDYAAADEKYEEALRLLPPEHVKESRRIRLERAKSQMLCKKLSTAHQELQALVDEMKEDPAADPKLLAEARATHANSQYYMTWLMRLEGEPQATWEPEIEAARQTYRLLAEESEAKGDADSSKKHKEDLESSIRLARMDLGELQGLPLPSQ